MSCPLKFRPAGRRRSQEKRKRLFTFSSCALAAALSFHSPALAQPAGAAQAMAEVQAVSAQRTGFSVSSSGDTQSDNAISYAVTCLLTDSLSIDEAAQIALLNNRGLQAHLAELGIAHGDLIEAGLLKNPILDALYRTSSEPGTVANIEWSISLDFISILTLPLRRQVAASEFEGVKLEVANQVLELVFDVQSAYYNMQAAVQTGVMYGDAVKASKASYEAAKMIHEAGNISDLALHQQQVIYEEQKLNLAEAELEAVELREELNMLMGLWGPCTQWKLPAALPKMPAREFQGRGLESIAVYQRLDIAEARQEIETVARESGLENATRLLPELEGTYNAERETDGSWLRGGGVSLPLPIFNQGQGRAQKNRARLLQAQHRYYALAVDVRGEVRKAFGQMRKSRDRVSYYDKIMLPLRKRIVEESHLMFNAMEVGPFELLETKRDEIMAKRDRVESLREYWLARSELERAMGGSFRCYSCAEPGASAPANNTGNILLAPAGGSAMSSDNSATGNMPQASDNGSPTATSDAGSGTGSGAGSGSGTGAASAGSAGGAS